MGVLGLVGLLTALIAGFVGYQRSSEPVSYVSWDASAAGAPPRNVELSGIAQTALVVTYGERIGGHTRLQRYIPITASGWQASEPIRYLLKPIAPSRSSDARTPPFAVRIRGTLLRDDLPGVAATGFEKAGVKLASTFWVLDPQAHAEDEWLFVVAGGGGILFLLSAVVLAIGALRRAPAAD